MRGILGGLALALLLVCPASASAAWFRGRTAVTSSYYYPAYYYPTYYYPSYYYPTYYYPTYYYAPVAAPVYAQPVVAAPVYATPTPAPACPPLAAPTTDQPMPPAPALSESRSKYRETEQPDAATARVSFWNRSTQDLDVRIDGQLRTLRRGKGLTLELPRQFVWQVEGRAAETERVPTDKPSLEIVIRR
jgi:hypothetical protein